MKSDWFFCCSLFPLFDFFFFFNAIIIIHWPISTHVDLVNLYNYYFNSTVFQLLDLICWNVVISSGLFSTHIFTSFNTLLFGMVGPLLSSFSSSAWITISFGWFSEWYKFSIYFSPILRDHQFLFVVYSKCSYGLSLILPHNYFFFLVYGITFSFPQKSIISSYLLYINFSFLLLISMLLITRSMDLRKVTCISSLCSTDKLSFLYSSSSYPFHFHNLS